MKLTNDQIEEIELELTGTCNLQCPLCARNNPSAQHLLVKNHRPFEEVIHQIESFPNLKRICLAGIISEPTLYKDFKRLIQYIGLRNLEVELYTNADTHNIEWWKHLGEIFPANIRIYFTVCGSTQELHEKYRKGSKLERILEHAKAFKSKCIFKNDYIQHIKFNYNREDFESEAMQNIISMFNNTFLINSLPYNERFHLVDTKEFDMPEHSNVYTNLMNNSIKKIRRESDRLPEINCKAIETKFLSIDQFGNQTPCFLYRMYYGTTYTEEDANDINCGRHQFCFECDKNTTHLLDQYQLERMA